ncbi:MAG: response regulator [Planctomycetes bacterium]|nr:response regulator [Planctomycetota bacterium]
MEGSSVAPAGEKADLVDILYVEDNPADVYLTEQALNEIRVTNRLHVVKDGEEAVDFLRRQGAHARAPRPDLILLDLNMPRKSGLEVLAEIKADPQLRGIPVVILTSSRSEEDIERSYDLHANCYVTKPLDLEEYFHAVRCVEALYLSVVKLPPKQN